MIPRADAPLDFAHLPKTVSSLISPNPSIPPHLTVEAVGTLFHNKRDLYYLPVVQNEHPVGVIRRLDFMDIFQILLVCSVLVKFLKIRKN